MNTKLDGNFFGLRGSDSNFKAKCSQNSKVATVGHCYYSLSAILVYYCLMQGSCFICRNF